jgi:trimeric autotransporter adhesin
MRSLLIVYLLIFGLQSLFAQRVTTVAGGTGDGGLAIEADLFGASDVAVDKDGNLIIADAPSRTVRKVDLQTGLITRIAGTGVIGDKGNNALAINAELASPSGVAVDSEGNIYISDQINCNIKKINKATGIITRVAGKDWGDSGFSGDNDLAINARLLSPARLAIDANDNLYIVDTGNQRIRKVTKSTGLITTIAGSGNYGYAGDGALAVEASFANPTDVAVDNAGNVYVCDYQNSRIRRVNAATGIITTIAGSGTAGYSGDDNLAILASLQEPVGILIDNGGNLIIADTYNQRIRKVDAVTGFITTIAGTGEAGFADGPSNQAKLNVPQGLAEDANGNLYFSEYQNRRVRKLANSTVTTIAGNGGYFGDGGLATKASLRFPEGVAVGTDGVIYLADVINNRIRKVDANGIISTVCGSDVMGFNGDGGLAIDAEIRWPKGLTLDQDGNLYFSDSQNNRVRRIDKTTGIINTIAGNGQPTSSGDGQQATNASLINPLGLTFDGNGNLYIVEHNDHKVRKVAANGIITTVAGTGIGGFSGDGGLATNAQLFYPTNTEIDIDGNLLIADRSNNRIRKVNLTTLEINTFINFQNYPNLNSPTDVVLLNNDLFVSDYRSIHKWSRTNGELILFAGNPDYYSGGYGGDDEVATKAVFRGINNFVIDSNENFYLVDTENNRIRKIAARVPQTVVFNVLESKTFGDVPFDLVADVSSGLPPTFISSVITTASIVGSKVTITGAGSTIITAYQPGDIDYLPSNVVSQTLTVNKAPQVITLTPTTAKTLGGPAFTITATASSGLPVTITTESSKIVVSGNSVTMKEAGSIVITASQTGNSNFLSAANVQDAFCINPAKPIISLKPEADGILLTSSNNTGNQWYLNSNIIPNAVQKTHLAVPVGIYTVKTTADDCISDVSDASQLLITSVEDTAINILSAYPNPTSGKIYCSILNVDSDQVYFSIIDITGRIVNMEKVTESTAELDMDQFPNAIYVIRAETRSGTYYRRIIKQ